MPSCRSGGAARGARPGERDAPWRGTPALQTRTPSLPACKAPALRKTARKTAMRARSRASRGVGCVRVGRVHAPGAWEEGGDRPGVRALAPPPWHLFEGSGLGAVAIASVHEARLFRSDGATTRSEVPGFCPRRRELKQEVSVTDARTRPAPLPRLLRRVCVRLVLCGAAVCQQSGSKRRRGRVGRVAGAARSARAGGGGHS